LYSVTSRSLVQQNQVLVGVAAAHVEAARGFAHRTHSGQQREGAHDVCFAQQLRNFLNLLGRQAAHRHLRGFHVVVELLALHVDLAQLKRGFLEADAELDGLFTGLDRLHEGRVAEQLHLDGTGLGRNAQAEHSVGIGRNAGFFACGLPGDHHPGHGLAVGGVGHGSRNAAVLCE
jgi:hypothetical protein